MNLLTPEYITNERFYRILRSFVTECTVHEKDIAMIRLVDMIHDKTRNCIVEFDEKTDGWIVALHSTFGSLQAFVDHVSTEYAFNVESAYVFMLGDDVVANGPFLGHVQSSSLLSSYFMYYEQNRYTVADLSLKGVTMDDVNFNDGTLEIVRGLKRVYLDMTYLLKRDVVVVSLGVNNFSTMGNGTILAKTICELLDQIVPYVGVVYVIPYPAINDDAYVHFSVHMANYCKRNGVRVISLHDFKKYRHLTDANMPTLEGAALVSTRIFEALRSRASYDTRNPDTNTHVLSPANRTATI